MNNENQKKFNKIISFYKKLNWPNSRECSKLKKYCMELNLPFNEYLTTTNLSVLIFEKRKKDEQIETILGKIFFLLIIQTELDEFLYDYTDNKLCLLYNIIKDDNDGEMAIFFKRLNYLYESILKIEEYVK